MQIHRSVHGKKTGLVKRCGLELSLFSEMAKVARHLSGDAADVLRVCYV